MRTYEVNDTVIERIGNGEQAEVRTTRIVAGRAAANGRFEVATEGGIWYDSLSGVRVDKATVYSSVAHVPAAAGAGGGGG